MKTKLLLTLMVIFTSEGTLSSQEYHPLLNHSSWYFSFTAACCDGITTNSLLYETGQEEYDGFVYTRFSDSLLMREDVPGRKVYNRYNGVENIVFDFSLEVGDSILLPNNYIYFVTAVEYITLTGGTRKKMTMETSNNVGGFHESGFWIEGVGKVGINQHPFSCGYGFKNLSGGGNVKILTCSFQNEEVIYGDGTCTALLNTQLNDNVNQKITFSPNPFTSELTIQSEIGFENTTLKLFNSVGQLVEESNNLQGKKITINRENLKSGLYLVQLFQDEKLLQTTKVLLGE